MYSPIFPPFSLLGLVFKNSMVAKVAPATQVSVIVSVYNGMESLEACISSINAQSLRPNEIIIVDDSSCDETPTVIRQLQNEYRNLVVLRNPENMGKAASISRALKHVHSTHTAIVDADTCLSGDYLYKTLGTFQEDNIVGAHGMVMPNNQDGPIAKSRLVEYLYSQATYKKIHDKMGVSFCAPGCCSIWKTEWLQENGVPTETVVEDMDLTWEAIDEGFKIAYTPEAVAFTEEPKTVEMYVKQVTRWFSWRPVLEKHLESMPKRMKGLVLWMMAESVSYVFWIGLLLHSIFSGKYLLSLLMLGIDLAIISGIAIYEGQQLKYSPREIINAIPYYYLLRIPTMLIFWRSFVFPQRTGWNN